MGVYLGIKNSGFFPVGQTDRTGPDFARVGHKPELRSGRPGSRARGAPSSSVTVQLLFHGASMLKGSWIIVKLNF